MSMPKTILIEVIGGLHDGHRQEFEIFGKVPSTIVYPRTMGTRFEEVRYNFSHESNGVHYYVLEKKPAKV